MGTLGALTSSKEKESCENRHSGGKFSQEHMQSLAKIN